MSVILCCTNTVFGVQRFKGIYLQTKQNRQQKNEREKNKRCKGSRYKPVTLRETAFWKQLFLSAEFGLFEEIVSAAVWSSKMYLPGQWGLTLKLIVLLKLL